MKAEWGIASSHLALLANCNRDPKKTKAFKPEDFNPFAEKKQGSTRVPLTRDNIHLLKSFVRHSPKAPPWHGRSKSTQG